MGNEANNMLPDSTSLDFLSDFGFGNSATADNIATKAAATIVSQQPAQPAKVVTSPWSGPSSTPPRTPSTTLVIRATPGPLTPLPTWCQPHLLHSMHNTTEGIIQQKITIFETNKCQ